MSTPLERLDQARQVLRDAWLEAKGCERCGGTAVYVEEEPWPGVESLKPQGRFNPGALFTPPTTTVHLPTQPRLRRYPCDGDHSAGIDPSMSFADVSRRIRVASPSQRLDERAENTRWFPMSFRAEATSPGQNVSVTTQAQVTFLGVKLVIFESNPGSTRITGWFVGAQNQMPMAYYSGGLPSRLFAPNVVDNELTLDTARVAITTTIQVHFDHPGIWEATLFGVALYESGTLLSSEQVDDLARQR